MPARAPSPRSPRRAPGGRGAALLPDAAESTCERREALRQPSSEPPAALYPHGIPAFDPGPRSGRHRRRRPRRGENTRWLAWLQAFRSPSPGVAPAGMSFAHRFMGFLAAVSSRSDRRWPVWRAREIGREAGLRYVYIGNVAEEGGQDTACPGCHRVLIRRPGFGEITNHVRGFRCPDCGTRVAGVGMS